MSIEKFREGQFSLTPEERKKAEEAGKLEEAEKKMKKATGRLREKQSEKAIAETEKYMREELMKEEAGKKKRLKGVREELEEVEEKK